MIEASYSVIMYVSSQISVVGIYKWEHMMAGIIGSGKYAEVDIFHMKVHSVPLGSALLLSLVFVFPEVSKFTVHILVFHETEISKCPLRAVIF
jgi:hypothetical protein